MAAAEIAARRELDSELGMSRFIPYTRHVTPNILATREGDLLTIFKLGGRSNQSANYATLMNWVYDLNTLVKGLAGEASDHLSLWTHLVRRRVTEYPQSHYDNAFAAEFDRKYRKQFSADSLKINELYVSVCWRTNPEQMLSILSKLERETPAAKRDRLDANVRALEKIQTAFHHSLKKYDVELLGTYERTTAGVEVTAELEKEWEKTGKREVTYTFSRPAEFLSYLINGELLPVPVTRGHLSDTLPTNRVLFPRWGEVGEIRTPTRSRFFGMAEIFDYEDRTEPGHLNIFLEAPFEGVLSQSFSMLSKPAAKGYLTRHKGHLEDANDASPTQIAEIAYALDRLVSNDFVCGHHHATMLVYGDTPNEARDLAEQAAAKFRDVGIVPKVVTLAIEGAFWAQLPCNWKYRPRPATITSLNFLSFSSFHNFMSGKPAGNPWGPAVTMFKTLGETPLYFNFHYTDPDEDSEGDRASGHCIVTGATGQGKTVLIGALMTQAEKFEPTMVVFDKDRGMEVVTRALGGKYFPLAIGHPTGWNPFQLDPTEENMLFLKALVVQLARGAPVPGEHGKYSHHITQHDEDQINRALHTVMFEIGDKRLRSITRLLENLPDPNRYSEDPNAHASVKSRLVKWSAQGEYGWAFDNPTDELDLSRYRIYGFDYTDFLEHAEIRTPVMMYLMHRTEAMKDGRRFIRFFDEFWKPLEDETFRRWAKDGLKTDRKKNALNVFATQEPGDALDSSIAKTIIQQCSTQLFLPNPNATKADYVEGFKLTESEFDLIYEMPDLSRQFVVKQGANCAKAKFVLGPDFKPELAVLSGSPDRSELLEEVIADVGDDPQDWLPVFVNRVMNPEKQA